MTFWAYPFSNLCWQSTPAAVRLIALFASRSAVLAFRAVLASTAELGNQVQQIHADKSEIVSIAATVSFLESLFIELLLLLLRHEFALEEVGCEILAKYDVLAALVVGAVKLDVERRHVFGDPLPFCTFLGALRIYLLTSRHTIFTGQQFAGLAPHWMADWLQANLAAMLLFAVVRALDVSSSVCVSLLSRRVMCF